MHIISQELNWLYLLTGTCLQECLYSEATIFLELQVYLSKHKRLQMSQFLTLHKQSTI